MALLDAMALARALDAHGDMAGALAWTLQLVFFVLFTQWVIERIERYAFRYRAISEHSL